MVIGLVIFLLILAVVIIGFIYVIRNISSDNLLAGGKNRAVDIAKTRYAKGEISKEEYEQLKKDLEK